MQRPLSNPSVDCSPGMRRPERSRRVSMWPGPQASALRSCALCRRYVSLFLLGKSTSRVSNQDNRTLPWYASFWTGEEGFQMAEFNYEVLYRILTRCLEVRDEPEM